MNVLQVKPQQKPIFPILDIAALYQENFDARQKIGLDLVEAAKEYGFFYIKNTGLNRQLIEDVFKKSQTFFAQPAQYKKQYGIYFNNDFQGYEPQTSSESKEAYVLGPERSSNDSLVMCQKKYHGLNTWPEGLDRWRDTMLLQMQAMLDLARLLNRALALGLGVSEDYFDLKSKDPMYAFRLLHYPVSHEDTLGIKPHTDWGALSLLIQDDTPGLEVLNANGNWIVVNPIPDTVVVNVGELVARWTNNRLKATQHRVRNLSNHSRYSIAFFLDMDHDAMIEPIETCVSDTYPRQYTPIRVSEFIDKMHRRDYSDVSDV